jgi:hypothetical protein
VTIKFIQQILDDRLQKGRRPHSGAKLHITLFSPQTVVIIITSHEVLAPVVMVKQNDAAFFGIINLK